MKFWRPALSRPPLVRNNAVLGHYLLMTAVDMPPSAGTQSVSDRFVRQLRLMRNEGPFSNVAASGGTHEKDFNSSQCIASLGCIFTRRLYQSNVRLWEGVPPSLYSLDLPFSSMAVGSICPSPNRWMTTAVTWSIADHARATRFFRASPGLSFLRPHRTS